MLVLNAHDVRQALPMPVAVDAMKQAFACLTEAKAQVPLRATLSVPPHNGISLVMPAFVEDGGGEALTVKVVSVFPENLDRNLPLIHAAVLVLEPETGRLLAVLEGGALTAIRTGAASGAATDLLSRPQSRVVAIIGAGTQARTQLEAVCCVRRIETVRIYDPEPDRAEKLAEEMAGKGSIPVDVRSAKDAREAVTGADILCTVTTSATPVFDDADIGPGTHINAVGSFRPEVQEVPSQTVARALVFVDDREASLSEAGDLIQPAEEGLIGPDHIRADLGELVLGRASGRKSDDQVTLFKSVGIAVQDAMAARAVMQFVGQSGIGQQVTW